VALPLALVFHIKSSCNASFGLSNQHRKRTLSHTPTNVATLDLSAKLRITEIYLSIQGESTWAGLPCTFVRLTGCPLRCVWCDTVYSFTEGKQRSIAEILEEIETIGVKLVEITGGEPLAQKNCGHLCQALLQRGYTVLVETSGAYDIDLVPRECVRIMDLKCPDSGEEARNMWANLDRLQTHDEIKFVIASRRDFEWARDCVRKHHLHEKVQAVLFSPVFGSIDLPALANWVAEEKLPIRMQIQMHKVIWPPDMRGV
jgi:7-carboxy-7-deazaguanine synthase